MPDQYTTSRNAVRFLLSVEICEGCWEWKAEFAQSGYGVFYANGERFSAHRYSYSLFNGPIPDGMLVCHACDNRKCVRPDHLWVGTHSDNTRDAVSKGRWTQAKKGVRNGFPNKLDNAMRGEEHPESKLTEQIVTEIRALRAQGFSMPVIAERYQVSKSLVFNIVHRKTWKHI